MREIVSGSGRGARGYASHLARAQSAIAAARRLFGLIVGILQAAGAFIRVLVVGLDGAVTCALALRDPLPLLRGCSWFALTASITLVRAGAVAMLQAMNMRMLAAAALGLGVLGFKLLDHGQRIDRLTAEVQSLRAELQRAASAAAPPSAAPTPTPSGTPASAKAARVPVPPQEIARIESAVMSLLEADRPELREKLRSVIEEQQQSISQAQREQRRERWVARRESKLLKLGLTTEQRQSIVQVMLGTRDQIADLQRSAQTPQAIDAARQKIRGLREQSHEQIRDLLSPEQYRAYRAQFERDDEDDNPAAAAQ